MAVDEDVVEVLADFFSDEDDDFSVEDDDFSDEDEDDEAAGALSEEADDEDLLSERLSVR